VKKGVARSGIKTHKERRETFTSQYVTKRKGGTGIVTGKQNFSETEVARVQNGLLDKTGGSIKTEPREKDNTKGKKRGFQPSQV